MTPIPIAYLFWLLTVKTLMCCACAEVLIVTRSSVSCEAETTNLGRLLHT